MKLGYNATIVLLAVAFVMTLGVTGCAVRDYCEERIDCEGGNKKDERACRASMRGERNAAAKYGCRSEYNDWISCEADNGTCSGGNFQSSGDCADEGADLYDCVSRESELY